MTIVVWKENNPADQHDHPQLKSPSFEHAAKLREVRDARRKRILARSSERLAYITASAGESLLEKTNSPSPSPLSVVDDTTTAAADADICKYLPDQETVVSKVAVIDDSEQRRPCHEDQPIKHDTTTSTTSEASTTDNPEMKSATMCQAAATKVREWSNTTESPPLNILSKLSFCMQCPHVQHARLVCATCTALIFLAASSMHSHGRIDAFFMIYSPIAVVFFTDLLLYTGAYVFISMSRQLKSLEGRSAAFLVVMQLLLTVCLDCSISASLVCGGFVMLSKCLPSYHAHIYLRVST